MSGINRLTDEELIAGWDDLKDNLSSNGHDAAEVLFDYGDKLADALSRRASQAAPAPSALVKALRTAEAALSDIGDAEREEGDDLAWCEERAAKALPLIRPVLRAALITTPAPSDGLREAVLAALKGELSFGAYDCTRVWEAWSVGTMTQDDFVPVSVRLDEITDAVLAALTTAPAQQKEEK